MPHAHADTARRAPDQRNEPSCRCRHCEPGLAGIAPGGAHNHLIDQTDLQLAFRLLDGHIAQQLAAGTCPDCGLSRASRTHREHCEQAMRPVAAPTPIRQPWEVRPSRRLARAA